MLVTARATDEKPDLMAEMLGVSTVFTSLKR